jgi:RND superfamily putative drug exporter
MAIVAPSVLRKSAPTTTEHGGVWQRVANFAVQRPRRTAAAGSILLGVLALGQLGTSTTGFGDLATAPQGSDSQVGATTLAAHNPGVTAFPTAAMFQLPHPIWDHPSSLDAIARSLRSDTEDFTSVGGPIPVGPISVTLTTLSNISLQIDASLINQVHAILGAAQELGPNATDAQLHDLSEAIHSALPAVPVRALPTAANATYQIYRATQNFVSQDGKTVRFFVTLANGSLSSPADLASIPTTRARLARIASSPEVGASSSALIGLSTFAFDVNQVSNQDLGHIIPLVAVIIAILLACVTRSLIAPVFLVATVLLSYVAALGITALIFVHVVRQPGVQFVLPFVMFVFLLALGSDYNVLIMSRIRDEASSDDLKSAVPRAIGQTAGTITTAGIVLGGSFATLAISGIGTTIQAQVAQVGVGLAIGILIDTFVVRTILVPSLVALLGKWTWWPSRRTRN